MKNTKTQTYRQTLRLLLPLAISMFVLLLIVSVLWAILQIPTDGEAKSFVFGYFVNPIVLVFMYIAPIFLTFIAFKYLNNRQACDFYDSLPATRYNKYISKVLAILTYIYASILIANITCVIIYLANGVPISIHDAITLTLSAMAGSTLVVAGVSLAMAVTGTLVGNFAVSVLILALPRTLLFFATDLFMSADKYFVPIVKMKLLLNPSYNIIYGTLINTVGSWKYVEVDYIATHLAPTIYTFILGAIYLAVAGYVYNRRKSESAGKTCISKKTRYCN